MSEVPLYTGRSTQMVFASRGPPSRPPVRERLILLVKSWGAVRPVPCPARCRGLVHFYCLSSSSHLSGTRGRRRGAGGSQLRQDCGGPGVDLVGWVFSYERGTPVPLLSEGVNAQLEGAAFGLRIEV